MCYVYDIVLNFNKEFYEFFEWKKDDYHYHIKKINLIRVNSFSFNSIYDNICVFKKDFLLSIYNNCEYYTNKSIDKLPYAFIITDSYRLLGLLLDNNGKIIKRSSFLLDEELDILNVASKLKEETLDYKIIKTFHKNEFKTRNEINITNFIKKDLDNDYKNNNLNKLKYLYYEYFNKTSDNIDIIYQELVNELDKDINEKHMNLYNLIKLSMCQKTR